MTRLAIVGPLGLLLMCGCGKTPQSDNADTGTNAATNDVPAPTVTYYQDLKPIIDAYCVRCHVDGGIGPFTLTSYDEIAGIGELLVSTLQNRTMPPFLAAPAVRPLNYDTSLSDEQIALFTTWLDAGKPAGDPASAGEPIELKLREISQVDLTLRMSEPYTPTMVPDEYRCFVIDWPLDESKYITGINVRPGNLEIAHHAVPYLIDPEYVDLVDNADGADGKPGYPCFGGATPPDTESFPTKIITGWAPGEFGQDFPENTGTLVTPGSKIVLQMHYSILDAGSQPDESAVDFRLADEVEKNAGNLPWLDLGWPANPESMLIPAGAENVVHEYRGDPTQSPLLGAFVPGLDASEGIILHSILPHEHKLGTRIWFDVERTDGTSERIIDIAHWNFDWQGYYEFAEPVTMLPGDELLMHCEWDNTAANQPLVMGGRRAPADVMWGEGTYDEMCAASIYVTGIATGSAECADVGSVAAASGRFSITFDAPALRGNPNLDGELIGPISGSIYRAEDVRLSGPKDGAMPVASFDFDDVDLRDRPAGPFLIDTELPAGDYQFLGFMDTDGNAATEGGPDLNDPIMIPAQATTLSCAEQPVTVNFPILLPNL